MVAQFTAQASRSRTSPVPKHITKSQWEAFETKIQGYVMEPEEFLTHWDCTYDQVARICKCSRNTVASWFCKGQTGKRPSEAQKIWLGTAHKLLLLART